MSDSDGTGNSVKLGDNPATAQIDVQDPLPETNWFWRRVYTFVLSLVSVAFIWHGIEALAGMRQPEAVYRVTRYMIGVHVLLITYYMVAPSAEQIIKIIQSAKLLQAGVPITRRALVQTPQGGRTELSTTAGAPDTPPVPIDAPAPSPGGIGALPEEAPWHDPSKH